MTVKDIYEQVMQLPTSERLELLELMERDAEASLSAANSDAREIELLRGGLSSGPAEPMSASDWQNIRTAVKARILDQASVNA